MAPPNTLYVTLHMCPTYLWMLKHVRAICVGTHCQNTAKYANCSFRTAEMRYDSSSSILPSPVQAPNWREEERRVHSFLHRTVIFTLFLLWSFLSSLSLSLSFFHSRPAHIRLHRVLQYYITVHTGSLSLLHKTERGERERKRVLLSLTPPQSAMGARLNK